jgi:hypothetical protein
MQLMTGMCAAKTLEQHLCKRFNDLDSLHVFILIVYVLYRRKFCIQEVLMHIRLSSFYPNAFFGLRGLREADTMKKACRQLPFPLCLFYLFQKRGNNISQCNNTHQSVLVYYRDLFYSTEDHQ